MNTEQKREAIRLKVVEAIPEILELKFGCKLIFCDYSPVVFVTDKSFYYEDDTKKSITIRYEKDGVVGRQSLEEHSFDSLYRIIGRPIIAQDILRASQVEDLILNKEGQLVIINSDVGIAHAFNGTLLPKLDISQNLSEWSPETIDALFELMF